MGIANGAEFRPPVILAQPHEHGEQNSYQRQLGLEIVSLGVRDIILPGEMKCRTNRPCVTSITDSHTNPKRYRLQHKEAMVIDSTSRTS
jgi:hypothetical protein